jgi:hypothetical protein
MAQALVAQTFLAEALVTQSGLPMWGKRLTNRAALPREVAVDVEDTSAEQAEPQMPAAPVPAPRVIDLDPPVLQMPPVDAAEPRVIDLADEGADADDELTECTVDGLLEHVGFRVAGKFYLFTVPWPKPGRPWKTPDEIGRQGLHEALVATYSRVFRQPHPCHTGPLYGVVVRELHRLSPVQGLRNPHLHEAAPFPADHRWKAVEQHLRREHRIKVHISKHQCYRTMYDYLTQATPRKPQEELDSQAWFTPNHPAAADLPEPPPHLLAAWRARTAAVQEQRAAPRGRARSDEQYTVMNLYDLLTEKQGTMKNEEDIWSHAKHLEGQGDRKLLTFLMTRRDLPQILERFAKSQTAPEAVRRRSMSRMEVLHDAAGRPCTCATPGRWRAAAEEVTRLNGYDEQEVESAVLESLELGRAKKRNLMIVGDTNRAKSFVYKPVELVYHVYKPPESGSHQLADIRGAEVIWLNEFGYDRDFLPWKAFKDFLEGSSLKVGVPKTVGANYLFDGDAPVLATAPGPVTLPGRPAETAQMTSRWRYFLFQHFFDPDTCPDIKPCGACWAQWLLAAAHRERRPPGPPPPGIWTTAVSRGAARKTEATQAAAKKPRTAWFLQKQAGSYEQADLPGQCFVCGNPGHFAADCPLLSSQEETVHEPAAGSDSAVCKACRTPQPSNPPPPWCAFCGAGAQQA